MTQSEFDKAFRDPKTIRLALLDLDREIALYFWNAALDAARARIPVVMLPVGDSVLDEPKRLAAWNACQGQMSKALSSLRAPLQGSVESGEAT